MATALRLLTTFLCIPLNVSQQLQGRLIAFIILQQLLEGLREWYNAPLHALPDDAWHVTHEYKRVRTAVASMTNTACYTLPISNRVCDVKFHSKSEFTPRYNPAETSIRSIIKQGVFVPQVPPNVYDIPEPHLAIFDAPDGQLDLLSILENGMDFVPNRARGEVLTGYRRQSRNRVLPETNTATVDSALGFADRKPITSGLEPGQGWSLHTKSAADNCDGTWDSFCGRSADNNCLFNGHNDLRGGLGFDSLSGWMILNLYNVTHGVILIHVEDWWGPNAARTEGWKCENGKDDCANSVAPSNSNRTVRKLGGANPNQCDKFVFEFAIDGKITSWDNKAWNAKRLPLQRAAHFWQLLDDSNYTGGEPKDVEVAMRLTGCARETTFGLSHIYWA
jgi:hypothetical protein